MFAEDLFLFFHRFLLPADSDSVISEPTWRDSLWFRILLIERLKELPEILNVWSFEDSFDTQFVEE